MKRQHPKRLLICFALISILLTACGGSSGEGTPSASSPNTEHAGFSENTNESQQPTETSGGVSADPSKILNTKLIYTANLTAETMDFPKAMEEIEALIKQVNGFIEYSDLRGQIGERSISYTLRIPKEQYETFIKQTGELCTVIQKQESLEDVSEHYFDQETRLKALSTKRDRLLALLEQAETTDDIIKLEGAIASVQSDIDALQGSLNHYDSLIALSKIELSLNEVHSLSNMPETIGFWADAKYSFIEGTYAFTHFIKGALLFVIANWPLVILVLIAAYISRKRAHKRTKKHKAPHTNDWSRYYPPNTPQSDTPTVPEPHEAESPITPPSEPAQDQQNDDSK